MLQKLFSLLLVTVPIGIHAQELLPNGSFEEINICCELGQPCAPKGWFNTNFSYKASGINWGKEAADGSNSLQLTVAIPVNNNYRVYIMAPLICRLEKNKQYHFRVKLKPKGYAMKSIGLLFTADPVIQYENKLLEMKPSILLKSKNEWLLNTDPVSWIEIDETYTAEGTEKYMVIGNFDADDQLTLKQIDRNAYSCSYLMDELSLKPLEPRTCAEYAANLAMISGETRRHYFSITCDRPAWKNLFPALLTDSMLQEEFSHLENEPDNILHNLEFETDESTLKASSYPEINKLLVHLFREPGQKVKLIGYTDNTGNKKHNLKLSHSRAKGVATYLVRMGIGWERVKYEGKGSLNPIDTTNTEEGRARNRRVEFILAH